jgi:hypothetical protein
MNRKQVYIKKEKYLVFLKNGDIINLNNDDFYRYVYFYDIVPRDYTETLDFVEFADYLGLPIKNKLFTQRDYIRLGKYEFYFDMFDRFEIQTTYQVIKNPNMDWLKQDLGFNKYMRLIFDKLNEYYSLDDEDME